MPNTYTQLYIQFVFAVKNRDALIEQEWKDELHAYITGIFQQNKHKMLQINSVSDHIHIFVGLKPHQAISQLIQNVKTESSKFINERRLAKKRFEWQKGFGAFSYSQRDMKNVIRYIINQEAHHGEETFIHEYREYLNAYEIDWDEKYIFKSPE
jgi:REP element-mobilizing transposase RayT